MVESQFVELRLITNKCGANTFSVCGCGLGEQKHTHPCEAPGLSPSSTSLFHSQPVETSRPAAPLSVRSCLVLRCPHMQDVASPASHTNIPQLHPTEHHFILSLKS